MARNMKNHEITPISTQPAPKRSRNMGTTVTTLALMKQKEATETTMNVDASLKPMVGLDPELLECPICLEPFHPPVYQCNNDHLVCESCLMKIANTCPSCGFPIGSQRCRAIENIIESATISCVYSQHGCVEKVSYLKKLDHEKTCYFAPISCPEPGCEYTSVPKCIYMHFAEKHPNSSQPFTFNTTKYLALLTDVPHRLFQERLEKILFVLHCVGDPLGSFVNVTCVAPTVSDMKFSVDLKAKRGDKIIVLKSPMELTPKQPPKEKCLLIWNDFHEVINGSKWLELELTIRKA